MVDKLVTATFAAGCFWQVEEAFHEVKGVKETAVGYTGGQVDNPNYDLVCTDQTGHAEAVQITYNSKQVSYDELLEKFWEIHDPTQVNRQGPDIGSQYRSVIFYHNKEQEELAKQSKGKLQKLGAYKFKRIVTEIVPASTFYRAEQYHQKYLHKLWPCLL